MMVSDDLIRSVIAIILSRKEPFFTKFANYCTLPSRNPAVQVFGTVQLCGTVTVFALYAF